MTIRRAHCEDADTLTRIAFAAKRHWEYSEAWIRRWRDALTITHGYIVEHPTFVAVMDGEIVGFCALQIGAGHASLDHLWILPRFMRQGIGRALFQHAEATAGSAGATRLRIVGDPHAEEFYSRMGAIRYGQEEAHMDGEIRFLPLLEKSL